MNLVDRDKKYLWHPLTQHKTHPYTKGIVRAKGVYLYDEEGNGYVDAISSWYASVYGHCHPHIVGSVSRQMSQLDHVVFSGFTHEPAVVLSEMLMTLLPDNQKKLFFSDNGSTATEVGIKMALQYHHNRGDSRDTLVAFEEGFHGDTFGAMSVSGISAYNGAFKDFSIDVIRIPVPLGENNDIVSDEMMRLIDCNAVAGFIYEPVVQGAAAMKFHDPDGLDTLLKICKENNVLTIADEVMTGFGKTGRNFASEYMDTQPDIMCFSKALTAGLMPMGLTSCTRDIYEAFYSDDITKGFFHGHTYTANPPACRAAISAMELLISKETQEQFAMISKTYASFSKKMSGHQKISEIRYKGVILAMELRQQASRYGTQRDEIMNYFMERGVFLRPLGNTIFIIPPYIISQPELEKILELMSSVLDIF